MTHQNQPLRKVRGELFSTPPPQSAEHASAQGHTKPSSPARRETLDSSVDGDGHNGAHPDTPRRSAQRT